MKGGCLHRLLVSKLCFGLVLLLTVPIIVLLLEGAPVLTIFSTTPEQLKVLSHGILQKQEQEHLGDDGASLAGFPGRASRGHTHKSRDKVNKGNSLCNVLLLNLFSLSFSPLLFHACWLTSSFDRHTFSGACLQTKNYVVYPHFTC